VSAYRSTHGERSGLFVPGVLLVRDGRIVPGAQWDELDDVTNWKSIETFVATEDLPANERTREGLAAFPRLRALLESAPIRPVKGPDVTLMRDRDVRVFTVGFARNADDYFSLFVERKGVLIRSITGAFHELRRSTLSPELAERDAVWEQLEAHDDFELADRILRAATDGLVTGYSLALARMFEVVATDRRVCRELERELEEIEVRARDRRKDAEEIVRILREAEETTTVPIYGTARCIRHPALTVRTIGEGDLAAQVEGSEVLEIPAELEWRVDDVAAWEPPARAVRHARERKVYQAQFRDRRLIILTIVLMAFFALLLVLRMYRRAL
jgi:hypothetical protein